MTMAKRKKRRRLERPIKQYELDQCALYGVQGFDQLIPKLGWSQSRQALEALPDQQDSYKVWQHASGRWVQEANPELRTLQARVATLLRRVAPPDYRHSGVPGRSFLTNAESHRADMPSIKTDIKAFYRSIRFNHVRRFFKEQMNCTGDVAFLLAKVCCYKRQHLPTGGVHSEVLAFYCLKPCFDAIAERAEKHGGTMTAYVDDIMVTMPCASHSDLRWIKRLFRQHGIALHGAKKSRMFRKGERKTITGVCIHNEQLRAPQSQHLAIRNKFAALRNPSVADTERVHAARSLLGHLDHIQQIDSRFTLRAKGNRSRLDALIREPQQ
jgi:hypothetical protein